MSIVVGVRHQSRLKSRLSALTTPNRGGELSSNSTWTLVLLVLMMVLLVLLILVQRMSTLLSTSSAPIMVDPTTSVAFWCLLIWRSSVWTAVWRSALMLRPSPLRTASTGRMSTAN